MEELVTEQQLNFSIQEAYTIITQLEHYPMFIPWCNNISIKKDRWNIHKQCRHVIANMELKFANFRQEYHSDIVMFEPQIVDNQNTSNERLQKIQRLEENANKNYQIKKIQKIKPNIEEKNSEDLQKKAKVIIQALDGPFDTLNASWLLKGNCNQVKISLTINFQLRSKILYKIVKPLIEGSCSKIQKAFVERLETVYGKNH